MIRPVALLLLVLSLPSACTPGERARRAVLPPSPFHRFERIVFLGDSITEAGDEPGGYVALVRDSLDRRHREQMVDVVGKGVSGNKVPDLVRRLKRDALSHDATTVVVYIGINDVWHWELEGLRGTPKKVYEDGLHTIVDSLQLHGIRGLLCTPSVIGERRAGDNPLDAMLDEYAEITRRVAADRDVELCDLRKAFTDYLAAHNPENVDRGILTTDGVHLNEAGNRFVARFMIEALERRPPVQ